MKANGRRRFRKMNARFRQRGSEVVSERARTTSAGKARKLILNDFWGGDPLPLPPRPFSPRSLVGMTQRARKRAARVACMGSNVQHEMPRRIWLMWWRIHRRDGSNPAEPETYQQERTRYRIGERLRPCPGCVRCLSDTEQQRRCDQGKRVLLSANGCDGSGVLPARRAKS